MFTNFFNPHAFFIMDILPKDDYFTVRYFINNVIVPFAQNYSTKSGDISRRRLQIYFDNSRCHIVTIVQKQMDILWCKQILHPLYSPDFVITDFYKFRKIK
jgi:hypothetical protein